MTRNLRRSYHNCYLSECLRYFENNHALYYNDELVTMYYNVAHRRVHYIIAYVCCFYECNKLQRVCYCAISEHILLFFTTLFRHRHIVYTHILLTNNNVFVSFFSGRHKIQLRVSNDSVNDGASTITSQSHNRCNRLA